jgi:hypothetical protein
MQPREVRMLCTARHRDAAAAASTAFTSLAMRERSSQIARALVGQLACVLIQRAACVFALGTLFLRYAYSMA